MSLRLGWALRTKKVSAICWSAVEAAPKQKPVMTPVGSTAVSKLKPSYHPRLLDHPMSACPAMHTLDAYSPERASLSYPELHKETFERPTQRPDAPRKLR